MPSENTERLMAALIGSVLVLSEIKLCSRMNPPERRTALPVVIVHARRGNLISKFKKYQYEARCDEKLLLSGHVVQNG